MNKLRKIGFLVLAVICALFVFTSCKNGKGPTAEEAAARISTTVDKTVVTKDFVVNNRIVLEGVTFTVTWESNNAVAKVGTEKVDDKGEAKENGGFHLVTINYESNTADQNVTLTATVANGKDTAQKSISFTVPKFTTATYAEYAAADKDTSLTVDGIVTGIMSKTKGDQDNALYLNALDSTGGFYIYKLDKDPVTEGIKEGMTVRASGQKDLYSGTYEIVKAGVRIIDETIKPVTPVDLTEAYKAAADLKAASLVDGQSLLVTVKGVTITSTDESNGYYKFKLGALESYIRISSSNCPLNADETKAFKDGFAAHTGWLANATGIVSIYNGAFYLTPVTKNAFEYISLPELSDAEQVAYEKESLAIPNNKFAADSTIDLALKGAAYKDVVISWTSDSEQVVIDATTGKATITLGSKSATVKLTATLTKGESTKTKEFTLNLSSAAGIEIVDPVDGQEYYFGLYQGNNGEYLFFTGVPKSGQPFYQTTTKKVTESVKIKVTAVEGGYKLSFVEDGTTKYITMSINKDNKTSLDIVTDAAQAAVFTYDTEHQTFIQTIGEDKLFMGANKTYDTISASWHKYLESNFPVHLYAVEDPEGFDKEEIPATILTVTQALAANKGETIIVTGTIKEIQNAEYGNIVITDGTSDILIYGIYNEAGKKYGEWEESLKTLAVGGTVYLVGERSEFNGTQQVKSCKIYVPTGDEDSGEDEPTETPEVPTYTEMTAAQALAAAADTLVKVTGTVVAESAKGYLVKDSSGIILVYINSGYDKSLAIGDTVTVEGKVAVYSGANQIVPSNVTKGEATTVTQPAATDITATADAFHEANKTTPTITYVKLTAKYTTSGNYHNLTIDGAETAKGSLLLPVDDFSALVGKTVTVEGYFVYVSGTVYLNIIAVSMTEVEVHEHEAATEWLKDATHHWHACATCEEEVQLDKAAHTGGTATCKDKAVCEVCGESYGELLTTHTWNDGEVTTAPTETSEGVKTFTCTTCNTTKTEAIAPLEHTHVAATEWTTDGTHHWHACAGCNEEVVVGEKEAHTGGTATCKDKAVCTVCEASYGELSTEHVYGEGVVTTQPTYLATGVKTYTCTVCSGTKTESVDKVPFPTTNYEVKTFAEAKQLGGSTKDKYTTEKYYVEGVIKVVSNTTYGNLTIQDESGATYSIYGSYSHDGVKRYDAMTTKPKVGDYVVLYGILGYYNAPQMKNGWFVRHNDTDYVGALNVPADKAELTVEENIKVNFELPLVGTKGSTISWESNNVAIAIDGANATVTQPEIGEEDVTVTLTATIKYGDTVDTKEFIVTVEAKSADPNVGFVAADKEALELPTTVIENFELPLEGANGSTISWESNNAAIVIDGANATVTRPAWADRKVEGKLVATITKGDVVDTKEFNVTVTAPWPTTTFETTTFAEAKTLSGTTKDKYTTDKYYIAGVITKIDNATFGNMYIKDESSAEFYVYGTYSYDGVKGYSSLSPKPAVGDYVVIYGILGYYNAPQMKNGWIVQHETNDYAQERLNADKALIKDMEITNEFKLPTLKYAEAEWTISEGNAIEVVDGAYVVHQPEAGAGDAIVKFTVVITLGELSDEIEVTVTVKDELTDAEKVTLDLAAIEVAEEVTESFTLPVAGANGTTISWVVKSGTAITVDGANATVVVPAEEDTVVLTATVVLGEVSESKDFTVVVPAEGAAPAEPEVVATFDFGANGSAAHVDGTDLGSSKSYTSNDYTLKLTGMSKVYGPAYDAKGNSCIKLGTSKLTGTLSFTVDENVDKVIIYVAGYKAATSTNIKINNQNYNVKTTSNNGQYTAIEIDTTSNKTVTFTTVTYRCMINTIEFWA